jgi:hypothetical protein
MKCFENAGCEIIVMPLTQYDETLPSFEGRKSGDGNAGG